jgi:hypothetical protein
VSMMVNSYIPRKKALKKFQSFFSFVLSSFGFYIKLKLT